MRVTGGFMDKDSTPIINNYVGPSGSGKTFKALMDMREFDRQIRLDPQPHGSSDIQKGCEVVRTIPELFQYVNDHQDSGFKACLYPEDIDLKTAFEWICKIAITFRRVAILADEANQYLDRNPSTAVKAVFFQSRHSQTRLFYTLFDPRFIPPDMRGNTYNQHIFKSAHQNFKNYIKEAGASPEVMGKYTSDSLPKYSYVLIEGSNSPKIISPKTPKKPTKKTTSKKTSAGRRSKN